MSIKKEHFSTFDILNPEGVVRVLSKSWVWCLDGDTSKALIYKKFSPQCNANKSILESFPLNNLFENAELIYVEKFFVPFDAWNC